MFEQLFRALTCCGLSVAASAQATAIDFPSHAGLADCNQAHFVPFGFSGVRSQLLFDAAAVATAPSVLTGVRFRVDRGRGDTVPVVWTNVTILASHSTVPLAAMQTTFAGNQTEAPITVFQGAVTVPAVTATNGGPQPWNVLVPFTTPFAYDPAQGNLLLEIVNADPPSSTMAGWLDAAQPGGGATRFGRAGDHPAFDTMTLRTTTALGDDPLRYAPGNTLQFVVTRAFTAAPGFLLASTTPLPAAVDLTPLGATGSSLYVAPEAIVPLGAWAPSLFGIETSLQLVVPNQPALLGVVVQAQALVVDPTANALGVLTSDAVEVRIGDGNEVLPVRQLDTGTPTGATGTLLDFGGSTPRYGTLAVRLEGAFF